MSAWLRLTLITMTVGGGFTGTVLTAQLLFTPQASGPAAMVICVVFLLMHLFVLTSGLLFVHNSARVMPLVVALTLQIPYLSSPAVAYRFADGLALGIGIAETGLFGWFRIGSDWHFNILQPLPWGLGVNLVAIAMLVALSVSVARARRLADTLAVSRGSVAA